MRVISACSASVDCRNCWLYLSSGVIDRTLSKSAIARA